MNDKEFQKLHRWMLKFIKQNQLERSMKVKVINALKAVWVHLDGKKTYIIAVLVAVIALLNASGIVLPDWVWMLLSGLGLGSLRAGVSKK